MNNETYLKQVIEIINELEERQASLEKTDYELNNKISFLQIIKRRLETDDHINISKVEEIINRETEEVKELLHPQILVKAEEAIELLHQEAEKAKNK